MSWKDAIKRLTGAKANILAATEDMQRQRAAILETITRLRGEQESARTALPPPAELVATAARLVDETGAHWARDHGGGLLRHLAGQVSPGLLAGRDTAVELRPILPFAFHEPLPFGALCFLQPSELKTALREAVPTAERPAVLERLGRELAEVEALEDALVDELTAAGLTVAHRPEVAARRERETRAREVEAQRARDRAWLAEQRRLGHVGTPERHTARLRPDDR
jgi:hypothetical protein